MSLDLVKTSGRRCSFLNGLRFERSKRKGDSSHATADMHVSSAYTWVLESLAEMADLARTFVSFSSTDIQNYYMMRAWKEHEHIEFNFADFQLEEVINSANPNYIKSMCAAKIRRADSFILLIGTDTYTKTQFVKPEVEAAIEKGCRLIGVNLNHSRYKDRWCPTFFADKGAIFVPFSSRILAKALHWNKGITSPQGTDDWYFPDSVYTGLGYKIIGDTAVLPPPVNPFSGGNRPSWAK